MYKSLGNILVYKSLGNILSTAFREHVGVQESSEQFGVEELFASHKIMFEMEFISRRMVYTFFSFDLAKTDRCAVFQLTVPTPLSVVLFFNIPP